MILSSKLSKRTLLTLLGSAVFLFCTMPLHAGGDHSDSCTGTTLVAQTSVSGIHENTTDVDHFRINAAGAGVLTFEVDTLGPEPRLQFLGRNCSGQRGGVRYLDKSDISQTMGIDQGGDYYFAVLTPASGSIGSYQVQGEVVPKPQQVTQQVTLPLSSVASCIDPAAPQVTVDDDGSGDQVVVIVVDQFGVLWINGDSPGMTGSLYTAAVCDSKTQVFSDELITEDGAIEALDIGTYYLRLTAAPGTTATSTVTLDFLPLPISGSGSSGS